jgi:hypothetical protein
MELTLTYPMEISFQQVVGGETGFRTSRSDLEVRARARGPRLDEPLQSLQKEKKKKNIYSLRLQVRERRIGGTRDRPEEWRASIEVKRLERFCRWSVCQDNDAIAHPKAR